MGHRRSWLVLSQIMICLFLIFISFTDPQKNLYLIAFAVTMLALSSATQDIIIDAFRIESANQIMQGPLSSMYIAGYRVAMLTSGAGSLWLAAYFGAETYSQITWKKVYLIMAFLMLIGILTTLFSNEPKIQRPKILNNKNQFKFLLVIFLSIISLILVYSNIPNPFNRDNVFLSFLFSTCRLTACFVIAYLIINFFININFISKNNFKFTYINPIINFMTKYGKFAFFILLLISLYRIADVVMGVVANVFYLEKGYNVKDIATYSKFFGVFATILGGFLGGYFSLKFGTMKSLFVGALIAASSNLLFAWLSVSPTNIKFLITVITADNISSGFAGAAFVIYLSGLTSLKFTATQYALFTSIMLFIPKLIAGYSGSWVDIMGYQNFFILTALLGIPVLILIIWISKIAPIKN
jgi:PAT family beta-lactamase induction signal transducer AmpG